MKTTLALLLLAAAIASPLTAQRRSSPSGNGASSRGAPSISLEMGEGMEAFLGIWGRVAAPVSLGVEVELGLVQDELREGAGETRTTTSTLGAGASVKWFLTPRSSLTPFLYAHGGMTRETREVEQGTTTVEQEGTRALLRGAVGLEWFASRSISVGGNVGARWRSGELDVTSSPGVGTEVDSDLLEVFTSGISVAFHF